jgi:hypothetical protein
MEEMLVQKVVKVAILNYILPLFGQQTDGRPVYRFHDNTLNNWTDINYDL